MSKTEEYYEKLGEFIVKFNFLDNRISFELWAQINAGESVKDAQNIGRRITTQLEYTQKVELLERLLIDNFGEEVGKKFRPLKKELVGLATTRNTYAHGEWMINYGTENAPEDQLETIILHEKKAFDKTRKIDYSKAVHKINLNHLKDSIKKVEELTTKMLWIYKYLEFEGW